MSFIQKFFPEANDPLEFPEETNDDDDVSSSSYQSAQENLNSKSEVVKTETDMVDSAKIKSDADKKSQSANNKSDGKVDTTTSSTTKKELKDTYTSNKTVSLLINLKCISN